MGLIGKRFRSKRTNVIYEVKQWFQRDHKYQCEFRTMGSLRIQYCMLSEAELKDTRTFEEM